MSAARNMVAAENFAANRASSPEAGLAAFRLYLFELSLVMFPVYVLLRCFAAVIYQSAVLKVLRRGKVTYQELHPVLRRWHEALHLRIIPRAETVSLGFWARLTLAPLLQPYITDMGGPTSGGYTLLTAGLVLAVMVVPYVTAVSFDVCRAVPHSQRQAALALGATRWQMIQSAVLPYARPGILGACFLALGRAIGETMAVTMVIGARQEIPRERLIRNSVPQEQLPLTLERVVERVLFRNLLPAVQIVQRALDIGVPHRARGRSVMLDPAVAEACDSGALGAVHLHRSRPAA